MRNKKIEIEARDSSIRLKNAAAEPTSELKGVEFRDEGVSCNPHELFRLSAGAGSGTRIVEA